MVRKRGVLGRNRKTADSKFSPKLFLSGTKAQITIFIIIGILILFAFAGTLYFTKTTVKEPFTAEGEPVITAVPQTFQPIQAYTENCLYQQGKKGLLVLGQQGGYIYPDLVGKYSSSDPTEADGLDLEPIKVPYWHYNPNKNNDKVVTYASKMPKLYAKDDSEMSLEIQLSRFVKEKIDGCLLDYSAFKNQGFSFDLPETKEVEVKIGEETVNFWLKMPVKAKKGQAEQSMDSFYVKIPLSLKHYFEVANQIKEAEQNQHFLETQGLELISVYSKKNMKYFPPTSDVSYELFSPYYWNEGDLKDKFVQLLSSYVPMLHYLGSSNFYYHIFPDNNRLAQKVSDNMVLPLLGAEDLEVRFDYFGWEPYFKTNSENGIIKPEHLFVNYEILAFGTQRYETHYDASYPVLVAIKDKYAFNNEGYNLVFALESNIRNNEAAKANLVKETYSPKTSSLACKEDQKNTGLLKTVVVDSFTQEPVEMVKIGFTIPEQEECEMGFTDKKGILESKYPAVYGGVVNFIQPEYLTAFYPIDTYKYKEKPAMIGYAAEGAEGAGEAGKKVIELNRLKSVNVSVKKKEFKKCVTPISCKTLDTLVYEETSCEKGKKQCFFNSGGGIFSGDEFLEKPAISFEADDSLSMYHDYYFIDQAKSLSETDEALIVLKRVKGRRQEIRENDFTATISLKGGESGKTDLFQEVQLVPGIYEVSATLIQNQEMVIPKEKRCMYYAVFLREDKSCFDLDESRMEKYFSGSLKWDSQKTYLEIKPEDLYPAKQMTFFVPNQDLFSVPLELKVNDYTAPGRVVEDYQVPGMIANVSSSIPEIQDALKPIFS